MSRKTVYRLLLIAGAVALISFLVWLFVRNEFSNKALVYAVRAIACFLCYSSCISLATGFLQTRRRLIERGQEPARFWLGVLGGVAVALVVAAGWAMSIPSSVRVSDVRLAWQHSFRCRIPILDSGQTCIRAFGEIDGIATIAIGEASERVGPGRFDTIFQSGGDFYVDECHVRYEPESVRGGVVTFWASVGGKRPEWARRLPDGATSFGKKVLR